MAVGSFSAGLSGLNANGAYLSVIGNNLANINTVGFKASSVTFQDLVSQTVGGSSVNPMQVGLGVTTGAISPVFSQGAIENTREATNVAIQGNGFFVVRGSGGNSYTRAGNFTFNSEGKLVTPDGQFVQGYTQVNATTGAIVTTGQTSDITVPPGVLRAPQATTSFFTQANLSSAAATGDTHTTAVQIYDSLGAPHVATITYTKQAAAGTWNYAVTVPGADITGGTAGTPFSVGTGSVVFNASGVLTTVNGAAAADVTITTPTWQNGAAASSWTWDLVDANATASLTGYVAESTNSSISQNGSAPGQIDNISIAADGTIMATFGAGQTVAIAQLALATFNNPKGLLKLGSSRYGESQAAGIANVGVAGAGGRGTLIGSALEGSNVDIAQEFTNMILAQRGYQANSKTITVSDELLVETLALKRYSLMWIASVPAAAPVVPGAAPAAPPAAGDAAFGDALDASLLDEQAPAAPAAGASSPAVFDQRALAAWLLTGTPVTTTSDAMSDVEAAPSETEPSADEDLDDAADAPEIAVDPMLVAPVATAQQPVDASTVQIPEAAAERPAEGNGQLMPAVPAPDRASGQDAASAQYGAGESAMTETAEAAPEHAGKAAEPQHLVRPKPEAAVKKDEAAVTSATPQGTESAEGTLTELGGHPGSAARPASHDVTKPVAMRAGAAATHAAAHAPAQAVAAVAESSAAEAAAPAAETANATSIAGQRGERETRDTTIGFARVPVGPAAAQAQAQMGGGDAQSFEQDARRSPAAQRLAAALSMTAPSGAHDSANGPAPVFSLPGQPAVAPAPIAAPVAVVPAAPTEVDAENVQTLVQAMRVTAKAGGWEATVRLKPEHLGEVTIALRVDGKNVSAIVQAESAGVRQWLMSQEDAVRSGMSEHGLQLDRFTVSRDGQRREAEEQQPQQQRRRPRENGQATQRFEIVV